MHKEHNGVVPDDNDDRDDDDDNLSFEESMESKLLDSLLF